MTQYGSPNSIVYIELSKKETKIVKLIKRAKLFVFLREIRHLLFDEGFQEELSKMYAEAEKGHPPVPPAQLALEDTYNLLGHALKKALSVIARQQGQGKRILKLAVICGADGWVGIETYGKSKHKWLKIFLALPNGIPSHDTFARLDPEQLQSCILLSVP